MAAELFSPPSRALDVNASPYNGATWTFYASGGSTPQAVFADADLSTSLGAVVTADPGGKFAPIYFDASLSYRGVCENADGSVTLHDIDPINSALFTELSEAGGAGLIGFSHAVSYPANSLGDHAQKAVVATDAPFNAVGDGTTNDTNALQQAINFVRDNGMSLLIPAGTYLVSQLTVDGSGYSILTTTGTVLKQTTGLSDGNEHPIVLIDEADDVAIGDLRLLGNIATDTHEYNHGVLVRKSKRIRIGALYGTNIRGDVLYCYGRTTTDRERLDDIQVASVSGTNIYRNLAAVVGGNVQIGAIINDGPVGYRDLTIEPNPGGDYQAAQVHVGNIKGGGVQIVSADPAFQNDRFSCDVMDLDWNRIEDTTPGYVVPPGVNAFGLGFSYCRSGHIGLLKLRDYKSYPISLAALWDSLRIDDLDVSNCNQTETTFNSVIAQQGTPGNGLLDIGYVKCTHTANTKWLVRSNGSGLKVHIGGGYVSGGLLSVNCVLSVDGLVLDAGSSTGNIIVGGSLSVLSNLSLSNASSATFLHSTSGCLLNGITGTVANIVSTTSNNNSITNSTINGKSYQYRIQSSDASAAVASAATLTLPLDRDVVVISGTTNITSVTAGGDNADRRVTLIFQGVLNFTDGSNLKLASTMATTADDTITICCDGTNWYEVGRSVN